MGIELLKRLARRGDIFTIDDVKKEERMDPTVIRVLLSRLEKKGYIKRIERGKYLILPLGAEKNRYTIHEFIPASVLVDPYSIGYWSALHHYGLIEQPSRTVFIQTTSRKGKNRTEIFGLPYWIIHISEKKFFGIRKEWIDGSKVFITNPEKTILDCLDQPRYCGGVIETIKALENAKKERNLDLDKLSKYAIEFGNSAVVRRLGYICHLLGITIDLPEVTSHSYLYLDPTLPKKGNCNSKWRLKINLDDKILGELE